MLKLLLLLVLLPLSFIGAQEIPNDALKALGSDDFQQRKKAQAALLQWGMQDQNAEAAIDAYYKEYVSTQSPEVKARLRELLETLVSRHMFRGRGFVGISMNPMAGHTAEIKGEIHKVVLVDLVHPNTAAERHGLKAGDFIWNIDDESFHEVISPDQQFKQRVSAKREGDSITLGVLRGGKLIEIDVVLGGVIELVERQENLLRLQQGQQPRISRKEFFEQWLEDQSKKK